MAGKSNIEWTEHTWNPIVGCSVLTPGCTNCYAMVMAKRIEAMGTVTHYDGTTTDVKGKSVWTGKLALAPDNILLEPLRRKKPTTYFVNSMGDLFHEDAPDEWIDKVWAIMALAPQHTFQVLTKRAERMRDYLTNAKQRAGERGGFTVVQRVQAMCADYVRLGRFEINGFGPVYAEDWKRAEGRLRTFPLSNVWLGVSAERQKEADERIPLLLQTPAAVRFVSAEPLLGPVDLFAYMGKHGWQEKPGDVRSLDWVIVGGESGPNVRPMHPDWARSLRDQCAAAGVPFFFKQWGGWAPHKVEAGGDLGGDVRDGRVTIVHPSGRSNVEVSIVTGGHSTEKGSRYMARVGKKSAGRTLDSSLHSEMPRGRG